MAIHPFFGDQLFSTSLIVKLLKLMTNPFIDASDLSFIAARSNIERFERPFDRKFHGGNFDAKRQNDRT